MKLNEMLIPTLHPVFDLCRVCKKFDGQCRWIEQISLHLVKDNPEGEVLITECSMFSEKNGYSRELLMVHPDDLVPSEEEGDAEERDTEERE